MLLTKARKKTTISRQPRRLKVNIDELTFGQIKEISALFHAQTANTPPSWDGPVVAQFIGRFVFVCNIRIAGNYCYLTKVRNVRYWESRADGLGGLAKHGETGADKIDIWPDQVIPLDKLGPVMAANEEHWS